MENLGLNKSSVKINNPQLKQIYMLIIKRLEKIIAFILVVFGLVYGSMAYALQVGWSNLGISNLRVGDTFEIELVFSDLSDAVGDSVAGFDIDVKYDSNVFQFTGGNFGSTNQFDFFEIGSFPFFGIINDGGGLIDMAALSGNSQSVLDANQADMFIGLNLSFQVTNKSPLTLIEIDLTDPFLLFFDSSGNLLNVKFNSSFLSLKIEDHTTELSEPKIIYLYILLSLIFMLFHLNLSRTQNLTIKSD